MQQTRRTKKPSPVRKMRVQPSIFETMMNLQVDLLSTFAVRPSYYWKKTSETPAWSKNIFHSFRGTIFKSILKLRPKGKVNWRNYGRCVGIVDRCITFFRKDAPAILKDEGFNNLSQEKQERLSSMLGEEEARQFYLKLLDRASNDRTSLADLIQEAFDNP